MGWYGAQEVGSKQGVVGGRASSLPQVSRREGEKEGRREGENKEGRKEEGTEGGGRTDSLPFRPMLGPGSTLSSSLCSSPRRQRAEARRDLRPSRVRLLEGLQDARLNLNYKSTVSSYSISMAHETSGV